MNPYRKLVSDTMLFGVSMFAARFLTFLLIQLTSAGIANAVVRYGLAPGRDRSAIFTTGLLVSLAGAGLLALQCLVMERDVPLWPVWSGLCLLAVVAVYRRPLWSALRRVARERRA